MLVQLLYETALKKLQDSKNRIKAVMLDITLPDIEGVKIWDKIKEKNPQTPVLLMSGYSKNDKINQIINQAQNNFIQKPFNLQQLSKKIKEILNN